MKKFTTGELASMRDIQVDSLQDTCNIGTYAVTYDSYGAPVETFTTVSGVACGVEMTGGIERRNGQLIITDTDTNIRLPLGTSIGIKDLITVTKRYGSIVTNRVYEVKQEPRSGVSGIVIACKEIQL